MLVRHLIVLTIGSICLGNPDDTYIAPLIDDPQRAPLVALLNTSGKYRGVKKLTPVNSGKFSVNLYYGSDTLIKQKFGDIHHRIQELEEKGTDLSTGTKLGKVIRNCSDLPKDFRSGIYRIKPEK
ncbi:Hypothetical predicted protein [Mytilus galloprovincialis]|uniref:Uncharacterized protein n=1 Tax=Mytilus galloprovincialis TaxID=29158 RepID=A0A8B6D9B0_MYTGA|nr:Hypothetical predicted protein [Mytilus galloprovincialis]